jgi:hypothetical protein
MHDLLKQSKVGISHRCPRFFVQVKVDHIPAGFFCRIGAKFDWKPIKAGTGGI